MSGLPARKITAASFPAVVLVSFVVPPLAEFKDEVFLLFGATGTLIGTLGQVQEHGRHASDEVAAMRTPTGVRDSVRYVWFMLTSDFGRYDSRESAENTTHLRLTQHWSWISLGVFLVWVGTLAALGAALRSR